MMYRVSLVSQPLPDAVSCLMAIPEQSMAGLGREDEDKHRRVRAELERGDVIEHVQTVARVVGVNVLRGFFTLSPQFSAINRSS